MKSLKVLALTLVISSSLDAQQWQIVQSTRGTWIDAIDVYRSDPDTVVALGDNLFLSGDRGSTWDTIFNWGDAVRIS